MTTQRRHTHAHELSVLITDDFMSLRVTGHHKRPWAHITWKFLKGCIPGRSGGPPLPELWCAVSSSVVDRRPLRRAASSWRTLAAATAAAAVAGSGATEVRLQQTPNPEKGVRWQCQPRGLQTTQKTCELHLERRLLRRVNFLGSTIDGFEGAARAGDRCKITRSCSSGSV